MNVYFIDTSVFCNIINLEGRNGDRVVVKNKLDKLIEDCNTTLILPFASIIETGNHIAHCPNGYHRRKAAQNFCQCLEMMAKNEAPWIYYGEQFSAEELLSMCDKFPDYAQAEMGFGDVSIVQAYNRYKEKTPAVNYICIWSLDEHLQGYSEYL